ncbi:hypothetical protein AAHA92_25115 [Salvia divinorum]|uniref:Uncharacterized protein n=1 Tax=Salvia divinorum TaxID=28513 RepID=A0ABD1G9Q2_SALDI
MPPKRKRGESSRSRSSRPSSSRRPTPAPAYAGPEIIDVDPETWDIRDPELEFFVPEEDYKVKPGNFSVAFHHGGIFFETKYVGGQLTFFDDCHIDHFQLIDLSSMCLKLRNLMEHFDKAESSSGKETQSVGIEFTKSIIEDCIVEEENVVVEEERTEMAKGDENVHIHVAESATIEEVVPKPSVELPTPSIIVPPYPVEEPIPVGEPETDIPSYPVEEPVPVGEPETDVPPYPVEDHVPVGKPDSDVPSYPIEDHVSVDEPQTDVLSYHVEDPVAVGEPQTNLPPYPVEDHVPAGEPQTNVPQPEVEAEPVNEEDVYHPIMEESFDVQLDNLTFDFTNDLYPIIEDVTHELHEVPHDVQHEAPSEVRQDEDAARTVVNEDVYHPFFEDVPNECPLHNEGCTSDGDGDIDQFISLAHMCRDEQIFALYFEGICQQQKENDQGGE